MHSAIDSTILIYLSLQALWESFELHQELGQQSLKDQAGKYLITPAMVKRAKNVPLPAFTRHTTASEQVRATTNRSPRLSFNIF
jgi:hypothetical protein